MADSTESVRILRVSGKTEGLAEMEARLRSIQAAQAGVAQTSTAMAVATETAAKRQLSSTASWDRLVQKYDQAARAQAMFEREARSANRALDTGKASADSYVRTVESIKRAFEGVGSLNLPKLDQKALNQTIGIKIEAGLSAKDSAAAFQAEFDRLETIAQQKAAQIGAEFGRELNSRLIAGTGKSARDAASIFEAEFARLDQIASYRAAETGQAFTQDLNARLVAGIQKSARESASVFQEEFDRLDAIAKAKADQLAMTTQAGISEAFGIGRQAKSAQQSASVFQEQFAQEDALQRSKANLIQTLDPMRAEAERNTKNLEEIDKLQAAGLIKQKEANFLRGQEAIRTDQAKKSIEGMFIHQSKYANAAGLARNEVVNLSRQLQDVVVTLQAGQPLSTILLQQGTQIADIFTSSNATMKGFFQQAAGGIGRFAMSMTGVTTGLLAVGAAATYVGTAYGNAQRDVERLVSGIGAGSGATISSINAVSHAIANQQRISVASAREIAAAYAGTGRISGSNIGALTGSTRDFAAQTGQDLKAASDELAKAFSGDVVKGAEGLNEKLGFLDNKTREYIRTLQAQGDRQGAIKAAIDAMKPTIDGAAERVSMFAKAWESVKKAASDAVEAMGKAVTGASDPADRVMEVIERRRMASQGLKAGTAAGWAAQDRLDNEIEKLQRQIESERALAAIRQKSAQDARASMEAGALVRSFDTDIERVKELREELVKLKKAQDDASIRGAVGNDAGLARATEATQNALSTSLTNVQRLRAEGELIVQSTMARTLDEQRSAAIERERLNMAGQKLTTLQQELMIQNQILQVQAQAAREARDANRNANDNLTLSGLRPFERAMMQNRIDLRELRVRTESSSQPSPSIGPQSGFTRFGPFAVTNEGVAASTVRGLQGLNPDFAQKLQQFMDAVGGLSITSGKRSFDEQAKLYAEKPHLAAPPGRSNHEFGLAADLAFATPEARARAHAMAADFGLAFPMKDRARNPEPWHVEPIGARAMRRGTSGASLNISNDNIRSTNDATLSAKDRATATEFLTLKLREQEDALRNQNEQIKIQEQTFQKSTYEVARASKEQELLNKFTQDGVNANTLGAEGYAKLREQVSQLADAYGRTAANAATLSQMQGAITDRQMLFLSDTDRNIAGRIGYQNLNSQVADYMRLTSAIQQSSEMASGFFIDIASAASRGKLGIDTLRNAALKLGDQIVSMMLNNAVRQFMGGMFGGAGGGGGGGIGGFLGSIFGFGGGGGASHGLPALYANGGVFGAGTLSAYSNSIVSRPTVFPFAKGIGLMGEAGPEAIMPLKRGRNGSLGVQVHSGGGENAAPIVNIAVNNNSSARVEQRVAPDGTIVMDILDGHMGQTAAKASSGRGALSPFIDPRVAASRRPG